MKAGGGILEMTQNDWRSRHIPVAFAAALLLGTFWINGQTASLGKVAREVLFGGGGAIGKTSVVAVGELG